MSSEGGTYYWLFRNLLNFNLWAGCAASGSAQSVTPGTPKTGKDWVVPAGWSVHSTLWQPNGGGMYWPFATIVSKGSEVVLLVRGSQTEYDWKADFDYTTTTASLGGIPLPGRVHQGFARVAASLWPGVQAALQSLSTTSKITNVYIAGHSLGAGVSTLLAYGTQVIREGVLMGAAARPLWWDAGVLVCAGACVLRRKALHVRGNGILKVEGGTSMLTEPRCLYVCVPLPLQPCSPTLTAAASRQRWMHCCMRLPTPATAHLQQPLVQRSTRAACRLCMTWCHKSPALPPWWAAHAHPSHPVGTRPGATAQCLAPWRCNHPACRSSP